MYKPEYQVKYDKQLIGAEFIPLREGMKTIGYTYTANKKILTIKQRDFYEKGFNFSHDGKFYRYSSSILNNTEIRPVPADTIRGDTIYNYGLMYRDEEDGFKIKFILVIQCDWKFTIPAFIYSQILPKGAKDFHDNICKFYQKNYSKVV